MRYTTPDPKKPPREKRPRKPMKRSRMVRKRARRIDRETELERRYKAWLHLRWCSGPVGHACSGSPVEQAHFRDYTGASCKEDNFASLPLCKHAHDSYDGRLGRRQSCFRGWTTEQKKAWFMAHVIEHCARFQLETGEAILPDAAEQKRGW